MSSRATNKACGKKRKNHVLSRKPFLNFLPHIRGIRGIRSSTRPTANLADDNTTVNMLPAKYANRTFPGGLQQFCTQKRSLYDSETADYLHLHYKQKISFSICHIHPFLPKMRYSKLIKSSEEFCLQLVSSPSVRHRRVQRKKSHDAAWM